MKTVQTAFTICFLISFGSIKSGDKNIILSEIDKVKIEVRQINTHQGMINFISTITGHQNEKIREAGGDAFEALKEQVQSPTEYNLVSNQHKAITDIEELWEEYEENFDAEQTRSILSDMYIKMAEYAQHLDMMNKLATFRNNNN